MLILTVKVDESIYIGDSTIITVIEKWTGEAVLQVDTDDVITINDNPTPTDYDD